MILLLDIGNSALHVGLAERSSGPTGCGSSRIIWHRSIPPNPQPLQVGQIRGLDRQAALDGVAISSVVPALTREMVKLARKQLGLEPLVLTSRTRTGIELRYRPKSALGADRIANAAAAHYLYRTNSIVVDMGTATTLGVVTRAGVFIGGLIMPGLHTMLASLQRATGQLPRVSPARPRSALGTSTQESMRAGVFQAHFAGIRQAIRDIEQETRRSYRIIVTGGLSARFGRYAANDSLINPLLTLQGLSIVFDLNNSRRTHG
jgi:type III pantothenate kinase